MGITGSYDIVFQFRQDVVNDVLRRQLADPTTTNPQSPRFLPRQLAQQQLPGQIQSLLSWGDPAIDFAEADTLIAAVELSGGFRPPVVERNLSLAATARMRVYPVVTVDEQGAPYVAAHPASADTLELAGTKVSYAVAALPLPLARAELTQIVSSLLPFVSRALLNPLTALPLTYAPESLTTFLRDRIATSAAEADTVHGAEAPPASPPGTGIQVLAAREIQAVAVGVVVGGAAQANAQASTPARMGLALPASGEGNAAITITDAGMNAFLERLRAAGGLGGTTRDPVVEGRTIAWRWDSLACAFTDGAVTLTGGLELNGARQEVRVELLLALDATGRLILTPRAAAAADPVASVVADSWQALLRAILTADHAMQTGVGQDGRLVQRFRIPGTGIIETAAATALRCASGELTLLYALPLAGERISLQPSGRTPAVRLQQTVVPPQQRYGGPVTAAVEVEVAQASFPPYDFIWASESPVQIIPPQGPHTTIIGKPRNGGTPGEKALANVTVTLVDLAGQTASDTRPVRYVNARRTRGQRATRAALVVALLLALATSAAVVQSGKAAGCLPNMIGCLSSAFGAAPTSTPAPYCSTTTQFAKAGAATAGPDFGDLAFPTSSVGLTNPPQSPSGYTILLANTCSNNVKPDAVVTFFTQELAGSGWSVVKTFPVNGDPTAACPSGYCWRKAAGTSVRYVMLENLTAAGPATIYDLQVATAPTPQYSLTTRTASTSIAPLQTGSVSASCQSGEQMLSGGFSFTTAVGSEIESSYPSGQATWTAVGYTGDTSAQTLTVSVLCLQANFPAGVTQVASTPAPLTYPSAATVSAACPAGSVLTGGGFQTTSTNTDPNLPPLVVQIDSSAPQSSAWSVTAYPEPSHGSATEQAFALCAMKSLTAAAPITQSLSAAPGASASGTAACPSNQLLTGGGFADLATSQAVPPLVFSRADVESGGSSLQWAVSFNNHDTTTAHNAQITALCATATPYF